MVRVIFQASEGQSNIYLAPYEAKAGQHKYILTLHTLPQILQHQ